VQQYIYNVGILRYVGNYKCIDDGRLQVRIILAESLRGKNESVSYGTET